MPSATRKRDVLASTLFLLSTACSLAANVLHYRPTLTSFPTVAAILLYTGLFLAVCAGIRSGRRWVKIIFLLFTLWIIGISVYSYYLKFTTALRTPPGEEAFLLLSTAFQVWAAGLVAKGFLPHRNSVAPAVEEQRS